MNRLLTAIFLIVMAWTNTMAQEDPTYKREIGVGAGLTNYIGDFNGSLSKGFQPEANAIFRHIYTPYSALKIDASYVQLKGSSSDASSYYHEYKDEPYKFSRTLIDVNATYEYNFWPYGTGRDYRGAVRCTPFFFFGLGMTATFGDPKNNITPNIPVGIGLKYKIGERLNLGLEWAFHLGMSDMLDGADDPYGIESSGIFKNTDCYSSLRATITYSFSPKCPTCNKDDW